MDDTQHKIEQLDRLLNDPDVAMQPDLVWALLDEIAHQAVPRSAGTDRPKMHS